MDRLEAMLSPQTGLAAPPCPESSPQQQHQQRPLGVTSSVVGHRAQGPGPAPYHPLSPPVNHPAGLAGPSRMVAPGAQAQDYGAALALRGPNSPPSRTALPPLASLANGPMPFDGPRPPSRSLHRDRERDRERERERDHEHQHRHGELVYAPPPPPPPPLQQPLQPPHQQTKNSRAQTLTPLGERLRICTTPQGPAAVVLRLRHHPNIFCSSRLPPNNSRLRLLVRAAQVRCTAIAIMHAYRRPRRLFLGRQRRCGVQSVTTGSGSAIPAHTSTSPTGTSSGVERDRALCR
jgi:hypothetical protein